MLSKLKLDDAGMSRCQDCAKLFEPRDDSGYCRECARERGMALGPPPPDAATLLQEKTERLMALFTPTRDGMRVSRQADGLTLKPAGPTCSRCRKREAIEDSDFCLACHLELDNVLGAASRDLLSKVELYEAPKSRSRGPSVFETYGEKYSEKAKNAVVPPHSQSPRSM